MTESTDFIQNILLRAPGILIGLTIHEFSHGFAAYLRGDPTAKNAGRLSLNPLSHLDFFGTLMLIFGPFGWAKPVPVNFYNLRNPRWDSAIVSIAGPASNIICAAVIGLFLRFINVDLFHSSKEIIYLLMILKIAYIINIGLSFFNLLPIPPLDGSHIVLSFLPPSKVQTYLSYTRYVPIIFLILIFIEFSFKIKTISLILFPLFIPYYRFWNYLFLGTSEGLLINVY